MDRLGGDPEVVGMNGVVQRVTVEAAGVAHLGHFGDQGIADRNDGGGSAMESSSLRRLSSPQPATRAP